MPLEIAMWRKNKSNVEEINLSQALGEKNDPETQKAQTVKNLKGPDKTRDTKTAQMQS